MNFARKGLHGCCADVLLLTYWTTFRGVDTAPPLSRQPVKITLELKATNTSETSVYLAIKAKKNPLP